jgi:hypothetical protein
MRFSLVANPPSSANRALLLGDLNSGARASVGHWSVAFESQMRAVCGQLPPPAGRPAPAPRGERRGFIRPKSLNVFALILHQPPQRCQAKLPVSLESEVWSLKPEEKAAEFEAVDGNATGKQ